MNGFILIGLIILSMGFYSLLKYIVDVIYAKIEHMNDLSALVGVIFIIWGAAAILVGLSVV